MSSPAAPNISIGEPFHVTARALDDQLRDAGPTDILRAALDTVAPSRLAVVSSFGTESAVLLKYVADVDRSLPILFLDTGWLYKETLAYRDALVALLGLTDVRTLIPSPSALAMQDPRRDLCLRDHDACCALRKLAPLAAELELFDGWINGRKRYQGGERTSLPAVEVEGPRLKFNPLARTSPAQIEAVFAESGLPRHPLERLGFTSVGCIPCTSAGRATGDRAGRWSGLQKTECGIHGRLLQQPVSPQQPAG